MTEESKILFLEAGYSEQERNQLINHPMITDVIVQKHVREYYITILTKHIYMKNNFDSRTANLGRYRINVTNFSGRLYDIYFGQVDQFMYGHPHLTCFGNITETIQELEDKNKLVPLICLLITHLQQCNPDEVPQQKFDVFYRHSPGI